MDQSPPNSAAHSLIPYSLFTKNERYGIVTMITLAAWFSTLSSFIYYPALPMVAKDLDSSITMINLTVTSYLVVSAVAPAIVGDAADMFGRRPVYAVTLLLYVAANIGIAMQRSAVALLLLRMVQSAGISGRWSRQILKSYEQETWKLTCLIQKQAPFPSHTVSSPTSQRRVREGLSSLLFRLGQWSRHSASCPIPAIIDTRQDHYRAKPRPGHRWRLCLRSWMEVDLWVSSYRFWLLSSHTLGGFTRDE
jgi:hypothetical protein